jgi:hypothetical protein
MQSSSSANATQESTLENKLNKVQSRPDILNSVKVIKKILNIIIVIF